MKIIKSLLQQLIILLIVLTGTMSLVAQDEKTKIKVVGLESDIQPVTTNSPKPNPTPTPINKNKVTPKTTPEPAVNPSVKRTITLAVGVATRFRCPELPIQIVLGNTKGFKVVESVGEGTTDFYLLPTLAGFSTNMFVEFSNSTAEVKLQISEPNKKGVFYDTEVVLDYPNSKKAADAKNVTINQLSKRVSELENNLNIESAKNKTLSKQLAEKAELKPVNFEMIISDLYNRRNTWSSKSINFGNLKMEFIGNPIELEKGKYGLLLNLQTKDKKNPGKWSNVGFDGIDAQITNAPDEIKPLEQKRFLLIFEVKNQGVGRLKFKNEKEEQYFPLGALNGQ